MRQCDIIRREDVFFVTVGLLSALYPSSASAACLDSVCYTYDALGRLTQADYADGRLIDYTYDPAGNRVAVERMGVANAAPTLNKNGAVADSFPTPMDTPHTVSPLGNDTDANTDPLIIDGVAARTSGRRHRL
ncbi:MAG: hypothetical protein HXY25_04085 [Alphaproteobacteria bacterium]|nr:hypothetical protein [Alphaproteobacteria bacterium]